MPVVINTGSTANHGVALQFTGGAFARLSGASVSTSQLSFQNNNNTVVNNGNVNTGFSVINLLGPLPTQIAGLIPLLPCDDMDCRVSPQIKCYMNPVFGHSSNDGSTYMNDINYFGVEWAGGQPVFIIQKENLKYFDKNATNLGNWTNAAVITNNNYGIYYPVGSIAAQPTYALFQVNWGKVVGAFGPGVYRISVQAGVTTQTQATLDIPIPNEGFPQSITGSFTIGTTVFNNVNFTGTYDQWLTYLTALLNTNGTWTITNTGTGILITGKQGVLSNNTLVKSSLTYSGGTFKAQMSSGGPPNGDQGGLFQSYSNSPVNVILKNPMTFHLSNSPYGYNNGGVYSDNSKFTVGAEGVQIFSGQIEWNATGTNLDVSDYTITVYLMKNGVAIKALSPISLAFSNSSPSGTASFSFPLTNGIGTNPPPLNPGDVITLQLGLYSTWTRRTGAWNLGVLILANSTWWKNTPVALVNTTYGRLTGGTEPVTVYTCYVATPPFRLRNWNCNAANGTVKFETQSTGTIGDESTPGSLFSIAGITWLDSVRVPGKFGWKTYKYDEVMNEYGSSSTVLLGTLERVRDKAIPMYKFKSKELPEYIHERLAVYGIMSETVLVSDYNTANANWDISQMQVVKASGYEPKYHDDKPISKKWRYLQRMAPVEVAFEQGVQSIIMSTADLT